MLCAVVFPTFRKRRERWGTHCVFTSRLIPIGNAAVFLQPVQFFSYFDFAVPGILADSEWPSPGKISKAFGIPSE